ncbi:hypothetical protein RND71_022616 [Anisodus tanguticus]|uniref:Uncharacterized protein n=1 Tax=Anisodus tanguticus TaxID=243964 RepID=A0AAE1RU12_9SOLA|nr:hypothetical protein RND71_022616 [Anisodus tanguticus]
MEVTEDSRLIFMYLHDRIKEKELWYPVELPITTNDNKLLGKRKRSNNTPLNNSPPVAKMYCDAYEYSGSWDVIGLFDCGDVCILHLLTSNVRVVLADSTLYWCTHDHFYLYEFDTKKETWLRSPSLNKQFHTKEYDYDDESPQYPILLGMGNEKFVLVVPIHPGYSKMALKIVDKRENSLVVSMNRLRHLYCHDDEFVPDDGKAM